MRHSIKVGIATIATLCGGALLINGVDGSSAFAQASAGQAPAGAAGRATTTNGAGGTASRRISRPRPNGPMGPNVRPGQVGPGLPVSNNPVALTASECTAVGGTVENVPGSCRNSNSTLSGQVCSTVVRHPNGDVDHLANCINEVG
jgi:hypothetical protein